MKVYIARLDNSRLGGGWSFARNLAKGLGDNYTDKYEESNIYLIPGATQVPREEVEAVKRSKRKIILRVDNALRNSRNRGTGMTRMRDFAELADLVIFQSEWSAKVLGEQYLHKKGKVIINGTDTSIFNLANRTTSSKQRYLYSRFNRDETKNWEMARYIYQQRAYENNYETELTIVGRFSPDLTSQNFDFYNNERFKYAGVMMRPDDMAVIYQQSDKLIYPYFNDACSNTLIEALCCGVEIDDPYNMSDTGGSKEILAKYKEHGSDYFTLDRMANEYMGAINELL